MDAAALLRAAASNHRSWFRRHALATGGRVERAGGVDMVIDGWGATVAFPRSGRVEAAVERIRALGLRNASCWSLARDDALGTRLVARGFGWGWQPHWMALDVDRVAGTPPGHDVEQRRGPIPEDVPYGAGDTDPPATVHLVVRAGGAVAGHVAVNPWRGIAGIYSMGVSPPHRRRGIGRALTVAAARVAAERGCTHAILNATDQGAPLYRSVGFESLGRGQTWWYVRGRPPTAREAALAEAIGFGDVAALDALDPAPAELAAPLPGGTSPLRLAVVTDRVGTAAWMLDRAPALLRRRFEPWGGTVLHLAVEWGRPRIAALAIDRGADPAARDRSFRSTPREWAGHFGRPELAELVGPPPR
jgi:ribosomal protein S18 acetylase RimI-like enzyme